MIYFTKCSIRKPLEQRVDIADRRMTVTWLCIDNFVVNTLGTFVVYFRRNPRTKNGLFL